MWEPRDPHFHGNHLLPTVMVRHSPKLSCARGRGPVFSACQSLLYLRPKFYAGSWRLPCRNPLRRRRGGWWSSTGLVAERSHGVHWRLESLWKCPGQPTDSEHQSLNQRRLSREDTATNSQRFWISANRTNMREWSEMLTGAPGFPGVDRGGMLGLLLGGGWAAAAGWSWLGGAGAAGAVVAGVVLGTGDVFKRLSASLLKKKRTQVRFLLPQEEVKTHQQLDELTEERKFLTVHLYASRWHFNGRVFTLWCIL